MVSCAPSRISALSLLLVFVSAQKPQSTLTCGNYTNRNRNGFNGDVLVLDNFIRASPGAEPGIISGASATAWTSTAWAKPWVNQSCCSAAYSNALQGGLANLYANWSYDYCGTISARCRAFLYWEEAAYQCDPFLAQYSDPASTFGALVGVPLCASFCDDWWDACRYDSTCATNWATNFPTDGPPSYNYGCAAGNKYPADGSGPPLCSTFASRFPGGGRDLCTNMWGSTFTYSTNASSCLSMYYYTAVNPNAAAMGYGATNTPTPTATPAAAEAALTQGQALGIGLGVGLGVPAAMLIAAVIAYLCGRAAGLKATAAAAAAGASFELPQRNPAPPAAAAAATEEWSGKA